MELTEEEVVQLRTAVQTGMVDNVRVLLRDKRYTWERVKSAVTITGTPDNAECILLLIGGAVQNIKNDLYKTATETFV